MLVSSRLFKVTALLVCFCTGNSVPCHAEQPSIAPAEMVQIPVSPLPFILQGFLRHSGGKGLSPAVVLLPVCDGYARPLDEDWGTRISSWGYVTLTLDSFGPRGIRDCGNRDMNYPELAFDAYRGLNFLIEKGFVDPNRVAIVGFAWGALLTFSAVERGAIERASKHKFHAAAMPAAKWLLAKMIWGFPGRRVKVLRSGSSFIPTRISRLPFKPCRRRPSISGIAWSSTNQRRINRAKRSVNFSTQPLGAVNDLAATCKRRSPLGACPRRFR